jgi:cell division protein FtsW
MQNTEKRLVSDLHIFLSIIATLIVIGMLFIYSSSSVYAFDKLGSGIYFVKKQLVGLVLGFGGLLFFRFMPLELIRKMSPYFFLGSTFLTLLTLLPRIGLRIHGSSRWLNFGGFAFQPSELLKISFILYLGYFLSKKEGKLSSFSKGYMPFLLIVSIPCLVLLKQPDFGMAVTLAMTAFMLFFILQFTIGQLITTAVVTIPLSLLLIFKYPYRLKRILIFLDPWRDPQGAGFQIIQSLIAIGSGSFWGVGVSHSKQKFFYLPMQHTDFIFSIIAEETGFIGASLLITLYVLFLYFGLRIAWQLKNTYSLLITLGFVILTSLQATINLAVATGLAPTKGIGLPFVSYGNSALICSLCFVGIIINCVYESTQ